MTFTNRNPFTFFLRVIAALAPWVVSMYILYRLEYDNIWSLETPHRGKISVIILLAGMGLSFLVYTRLFLENRSSPGASSD